MPTGKYERTDQYRKYKSDLMFKIREEYSDGAIASVLAEKYGVKKLSIYTLLKGIPKHKKQRPGIHITLIKGRDYYEMLGLVFGDGWITKYQVNFCSTDADLVDFVLSTFKKINPSSYKYTRSYSSRFGKLYNPPLIANYAVCNSLSFADEVRLEFNSLNKLEGENLEGFVDGLMSAEGCCSGSVSFAQSEPNFSMLMPIIRKYLGEERHVSINQNKCKQAHRSPFILKDKLIFTHCNRKLTKLRNCPYKYSNTKIRNKNLVYDIKTGLVARLTEDSLGFQTKFKEG